MLVCALTDPLELLLVPDLAAVDDESSDSPDSPDSREEAPVAELRVLELAAAVCVVVARCPSCQASTPPSESMLATLSAAATLRARAARGLRRGRPARVGAGVGVGIDSSMTVNVRTGGERVARAG